MAFDEALDRHSPDAAMTHEQPSPAASSTAAAATDRPGHWLIRTPRPGSPVEAIGTVTSVLLGAVWVLGVYGGIVYWAVQGSLMGVILSAVVPGFGVLSLWPLLTA